MGTLIPLALSLSPDIARWLSGETGDTVAAAVSEAIKAVTATDDPVSAAAFLQANPGAVAQLRVVLAKLAAEQETALRQADLDRLANVFRGASVPALGPRTSAAIVWSAPVVSGLVLLTFGVVMAVVLVFGVPPGSETTSNMLLGTLAAMATSVVSYWVGSSAGSARKEDRLAQMTK